MCVCVCVCECVRACVRECVRAWVRVEAVGVVWGVGLECVGAGTEDMTWPHGVISPCISSPAGCYVYI